MDVCCEMNDNVSAVGKPPKCLSIEQVARYDGRSREIAGTTRQTTYGVSRPQQMTDQGASNVPRGTSDSPRSHEFRWVRRVCAEDC